MKRVIIAGMGPGSKSCITEEVKAAIDNAEIIIGSKRLIEEYPDKKTFYAVTADNIVSIIEEDEAQEYVVLLSGDTGFYSGTRKLADALEGKYEYRILPGISSVIYFAARIGKPWENAAFVSVHGKKQSYIPVVLQNEMTYFLTQGNVSQICKQLQSVGLSKAHVWVGENLSYENEKISSGEVSEFTEYESAGLTVMAVYNDYSHTFSITGIPDSYFIRSDVPMTKREIRAGVMSRMAVRKNSCVYDIGAGTGSVSVELALHAPYGTVYAEERTEVGCSLIDSILRKNPNVHVVATAVTLETLQDMISLMEKNNMSVLDIVQIAVTQIKKTGRYHMMSANNPVFIIEGRRMQ